MASEEGSAAASPDPDAHVEPESRVVGRAAADNSQDASRSVSHEGSPVPEGGDEDGADDGAEDDDASGSRSSAGIVKMAAGKDKDGENGEEHDRDDEDEDSCDDGEDRQPARASRRARRGRGHGQGRSQGQGRGRGRVSSRDGDEDEEEEAGSDEKSDDESDLGIRLGLRILQDLLNTNSTFLHYPEAKKGMVDYHEVIEKPMWFEEIQRRFDDGEYTSIVDFVKDVRLLLLNVYRYFGPHEVLTKRALRIEQVFEHKLAALPNDLKYQCSLISTHDIETNNSVSDRQNVRKTGEFFSHLLESVSGEREEREKRMKDTLNEERRLDKEGRGKEILKWECEVLLLPPAITQMRTMWEIPLIGHLIQLTVQVLCIEQIPQYEVERMFLMPQASKALAILMTSLLSSPVQRPKLQQLPPMPYYVWSRKLAQRVAVWYKMFHTRNHDWPKIFELCGIEKEFWSILGDWNQLEDYEFHELSFHQRVWLVKSLCDYQVHNHKTMQDALADHSQQEQNCEFLGEDRHGRQYLHFPQFCSAPGLCTCVRVYRCVIPIEKTKSPDYSEVVTHVPVRTRRGGLLPTWFKGRGKVKGKSNKGKISKKKIGDSINNRNFVSRTVYRMPNGMHIRRRKKCELIKASEETADISRQEEKAAQVNSSALPKTPVQAGDHPSDSEDKSQAPNAIGSSRRVTRQSRLRQSTSQGFYADWSDSDSISTSSPCSSVSKTAPRPKRGFVSVPMKVEGSTNNGLKLRLKQQGKDDALKPSDESGSGNSDDDGLDKSPTADEEDSSNESVGDEGASHGTWTAPTINEKNEDCGEDSEDVDEDEKDERIPVKKEDGDFNLTDDFPWMPTHKELKNKQKRPHFNPESLLLGAEHFELVADSAQGVRDLIDSLCEEDDDVGLLQRLKKTASPSKPMCEEKLECRLLQLIEDIGFLEVKMESNARKLRWKLFEEWEEFQNRLDDVKIQAEAYWRNVLECGMDASVNTTDKVEKSEEKSECFDNKKIAEKGLENDQSLDGVDDESQSGCEIRHSLRAKKPKVNTQQHAWLHTDSEDEESDEEQDDAWVMPGRRRKKKPSSGRSRKNKKDVKSDDEGEKPIPKKTSDKSLGVMTNFSFESCGFDKESSQDDGDTKPIFRDNSQLKVNQKLLPNKLTLDKEGNMFITLGCGTKVHLKKDEEGRIIVPEGHEGLSMIRGKTLEQLVGSGKVVQNKKRKRNRPQNTNKAPPSNRGVYPTLPAKRSTTLFPAVSPGDIVQAKEWMPPVVKNSIQVKDLVKLQGGTSIQAKEWTPPLEKKISSSVVVTSTESNPRSQFKTYLNRKNPQSRATKVSLQPQATPTTQPEEVVLLSDGSDDSIEVIKETDGKKGSMLNGGPRIESVVGNATVDSFTAKPLTQSVTMTPVSKPKTQTSKKRQWSPIITNTVSLEPVSSSSRVPAPGAPQVVITPAKNVPARRNLQQTGVYHQPKANESFVPINTIPVHQAQSQFVTMDQPMSVNNQFQPIAQVVRLNNQYIVSNSPFPQMGNPYLMNATPTYHYVPVTQATVPLPLPVSAFDVGLPPGLTGQIVLANGDNNQFSYAFKLDDGGLIFLTNEQVSKIRAANGGKLTTMVQFQTH